jgi:putative peptidoglycan lipid II flippase
MSVSAAELPAMSSAVGSESEVAETLRGRLNAGLRQITYFVLPSAIGFLVLGDVIVGAIYQTGQFRHADVMYVWAILAGATVGLLASTLGRLYSSTYYALQDTKTPLLFAVIRVVLTTILGYLFALPMPHWIGIDQKWGVAGLTISAGISSWVEFTLLRRKMNERIGKTGLSGTYLLKGWGVALVAAAAGRGIFMAGAHVERYLLAAAVLGVYGGVYFLGTYLLGMPEAKSIFGRALRISGRGG